jgi:peptidoglycan/LPS O-acetylase OafA/YrhL
MAPKINFQTRDNNLNFIRFFAASTVLFSHSFALSKLEEPPLLSSLAVNTFIFISGFFVTKSWLTTQDLFLFIKKRFLRIYPGLICALFFGVFIIGPLVTYVPLNEYFKDPLTIKHIANIFLYPFAYTLPGVFENNPYPDVVNGSLWFIPVLVFLYASLSILGLFRLIHRKPYVVSITVLLFVLFFLYDMANLKSRNLSIFTMPVYELLHSALYFYIGTACYLYRDKIVLKRNLAFFALAIFFISFKLPHGLVIILFTLPYLILYFAFLNISALKIFKQKTDLSYGIYIYAFPTQQTLIHYFRTELNIVTFIIVSFMLTLILAYLSWRLIEEPFLKLKDTKSQNQSEVS